MEQGKLLNIQIVPTSDDQYFAQRENGVTHTSYMEETIFLSYIQQGNIDMVKQLLTRFIDTGIVIGRLSKNPVRQMQYWAVCCITLATRYAIQGGLAEMEAFNLSDSCIMQIDRFTTTEEIIEFLKKSVLDLTRLIKENAHGNCPSFIRSCYNYIDKHLHESINLSDLAEHTGFSADYLSRAFKKYTGKSARDYIMDKKLEAAKAMLRGECEQHMIAYYLGFSSQSYFITCFKKVYGITPHKYAAMCRSDS